MEQSLTIEEMIRYVTLREKTPESVRFVVRVNGMMATDEALRRKIGALEALYETLTQAPCEEREALLWESARGEEGLRMH